MIAVDVFIALLLLAALAFTALNYWLGVTMRKYWRTRSPGDVPKRPSSS